MTAAIDGVRTLYYWSRSSLYPNHRRNLLRVYGGAMLKMESDVIFTILIMLMLSVQVYLSLTTFGSGFCCTVQTSSLCLLRWHGMPSLDSSHASFPDCSALGTSMWSKHGDRVRISILLALTSSLSIRLKVKPFLACAVSCVGLI